MNPHMRIARPVTSLERTAALYSKGLGLIEIGRFGDHDGFDGIMLGQLGSDYHFEFTYCNSHPVAPAATAEDLVVFYVPDPAAWEQRCAAMLSAGFTVVESFNPYWDARGRTFADTDGYRVVIQRAAWSNDPGPA
ncbi:VOC family protein [Chloroflexia bacterium SDU3-3]|nr:VOC family protein [Chloroflexia bacterium SDU3-3]